MFRLFSLTKKIKIKFKPKQTEHNGVILLPILYRILTQCRVICFHLASCLPLVSLLLFFLHCSRTTTIHASSHGCCYFVKICVVFFLSSLILIYLFFFFVFSVITSGKNVMVVMMKTLQTLGLAWLVVIVKTASRQPLVLAFIKMKFFN